MRVMGFLAVVAVVAIGLMGGCAKKGAEPLKLLPGNVTVKVIDEDVGEVAGRRVSRAEFEAALCDAFKADATRRILLETDGNTLYQTTVKWIESSRRAGFKGVEVTVKLAETRKEEK